ncbi:MULTISPECIES: hypothetical protein [Bradyrhizobium]|uniref:Zinc ribbon domain-containing protein n=1 Tax=Bradyrhizobium yuanmingense TaxID=108015 RepID=A0ABV4GM90_9BRAD|nr:MULTISPECIES: hypothetical protein [Bradyrhizobium]MCA1393305.1 hypothetical protein [Bradyrhizobium sp. IC3123]MCA1437274.1 hypothetical protein [Bradyrhizobium sp. BRP20]MCA1472580.1 hypothetical protein [Bradyrhizobium sp. IC3195]MCA1479767.1 hypothetical protein [Bradyrhizobium sp. NBAIM08]MCA1551360.1 hypothetical protein [Bradyrhizobium sp. BRP19]
MTGGRVQEELIGCSDCGGNVSFSAVACPHCGSREPAGHYVQSSEEQRLHPIEELNDQALIGMIVLCTGIGFFYGAVMIGPGGAAGYGLVGAIIGASAGFIINVSPRLFG